MLLFFQNEGSQAVEKGDIMLNYCMESTDTMQNKLDNSFPLY